MYIQSKMINENKAEAGSFSHQSCWLDFRSHRILKQLSHNTVLKTFACALTETGFVGVYYIIAGFFFFLKTQWHVAVPSHLYVADTCCHFSANSPGRQLCRRFFALSALRSGVEERKGKYGVWGLNRATARIPETCPFLTLENWGLGLIFEFAACRTL